MPQELEPSTNEQEFVLQALEEKIRLDGREFDAYRNLELSFGEDYGAVDVSLGNSRVIAQISAQVTKPFPDRPFDGLFIINTELGPMASPAFEMGRPHPTSQKISRLLEKAIRHSSALDTESLCIRAGQKVWSVRADVRILSHDGNLTDVSCIALVAALQHFRRPDTSTEGAEVRIYTLDERVPVPLSILHTPICVTFSFFPDLGWVLDATLLEEQVREGELTLALNRWAEVCQISKAGGACVDAPELLGCVRVALVKVKAISAFIEKRLKEDEALREGRGLGKAEATAENER
ncbi:MAG: hypothetical protein M1829_001933 [Trizodia sp. TS-e1964]|nr:MAG: hypothetical protein M1829_001933 [Trizodia sp. TS-e1964]